MFSQMNMLSTVKTLTSIEVFMNAIRDAVKRDIICSV